EERLHRGGQRLQRDAERLRGGLERLLAPAGTWIDEVDARRRGRAVLHGEGTPVRAERGVPLAVLAEQFLLRLRLDDHDLIRRPAKLLLALPGDGEELSVGRQIPAHDEPMITADDLPGGQIDEGDVAEGPLPSDLAVAGDLKGDESAAVGHPQRATSIGSHVV